VDPFCRTIASCGDETLQARADIYNSSSVFEAWDVIAGLRMPELGGSPRHLGIVGLNYYWTNQWQIDRPHIPLPDSHPQRIPLSEIVRIVWERYGSEILITETSHVGDKRADWLKEITTEVELIRALRIPLQGVCWYPILEMPEWHSDDKWTRMGLWDLDHKQGTMHRIPYVPALNVLREVQQRLDSRENGRFSSCA
jgi:hypothetical protein